MATMTMNIPVPKQSKPKPYVDPLRVKPSNGSVKCDPKDPRFRFCFMLKYLAWNTAERKTLVEVMETATNDSQLVNLGQVVNNYTSHYTMIQVHHEGMVEAMIKFWKKKSINPLNLWTDIDILDINDFYIQRDVLREQYGATFVIYMFEKCFEEAVTFELKGEYKYSGANWNLNGTLNPDFY